MAKLSQSLNMTQSLRMTPQLQQAIKLLQLSRMELETAVRKELEENPILEEVVGLIAVWCLHVGQVQSARNSESQWSKVLIVMY